MDRNEACRRAQAHLDGASGVDAASRVYEAGPAEQAVDVGWAWVISWNTARYHRSGHIQDSLGPGSGPLVVVKDTRDVWMMGSAAPPNDWLRSYADEHGYDHTIPYNPAPPDLKALAAQRAARMPELTREQAVTVAQRFLDESAPDDEPQAVGPADDAVDMGFAWVLPWNSARYYETGNPADADESRTGPLLLVKDTQQVWELDDDEDIDEQVAKYADLLGYLYTKRYS